MSISGSVGHISFDMWLTLIRSAPDFKPQRNRLMAAHFGVKKSEEEIGQAVRHYDRLFERISMLSGRTVLADEIILVILDGLGVETAEIRTEQLAAFYVDMERLFFLHPPQLIEPATAAIFGRLREKGMTLSLLSNTAFIRGATLRKLLEQYELDRHLDFQLYSDEIGFAKPSAGAFARMWEEVSARRTIGREMVLHVGDNPVADVRGASDAGFRSMLFHPEQSPLAALLK